MIRAVPTLIAVLGAALGLDVRATEEAADVVPVDFNRDVRPILAESCVLCHGPDPAVREADLRLDVRASALADRGGYAAIVPGDADASELWLRITDEADPMPPRHAEKRLSPREIEILRRWIDEGARWDEHWAYAPPVRVAPPAVRDAGWARDPLDRYVLARIEAAGLAPAPEAAPATWLRRASLDLVGLPPALAELDLFEAEVARDGEAAYARAVDRLLASPRYGEHMARGWLDAARYGDTHGFHFDNERSLWRWRDWVIDAFNANLPYDRFALEQLAGDLLPDPTLDQRIATGFNRCNPTTGEGGLIDEEYLVRYAVDRASTVATVFLGSTLACAQCHDHKYDPFTQKDFYRFYAYFRSIDEQANDLNALAPPPAIAAPTREQAARLAELDAALREVEEALAAPVPELDAREPEWIAARAAELGRRWHALAPLAASSEAGSTLTVLADGSVRASGAAPDRDAYVVVAQTDAATLGALHLEVLPDAEAQGRVGRSPNGNAVLSRIALEVAPRGRDAAWRPVALAGALADFAQTGFPVQGALDPAVSEGWGLLGGESQPHVATFALAEPLALADGALLRVRLEFGSRYAQHALARVRVSVSTEAAEPATWSPWSVAGPLPAASFEEAYAADAEPADGWRADAALADGMPHAFEGERAAENAAIWLARTVRTAAPRALELALGSDDALKLWVNGALVLARDARRPLAPDQDRIVVHLPAGESRIVLKVVNAAGPCGFAFRVAGEDAFQVPFALASALARAPEDRDDAERDLLRRTFRAERWDRWPELDRERAGRAAERAALAAAVPMTMIARDRAEPRPTHVLLRGAYDQPGEAVEPGTPAFLPPPPPDAPPNRLGLARWIVAPGNPLFARVAVNRLCAQVLGRGPVASPEDFGTRGAFPTHPELLDALALDFIESGFDQKALLKRLVLSATYRQGAAVSKDARAADPENLLYARASRHRLDAEVLRDQALFLSGLLVERVGGPSVKPYQPEGLWEAVAYPTSNTARYVQDQGDALHRRSLYTFWKRTSPPPAMAVLDAPAREACVVRRARTSTPLQALALMNDVQMVEAARGLAARLLRGDGPDAERLARGFRAATARAPGADELAILAEALAGHRAAFAADPEGARALLAVGASDVGRDLDAPELAAWTLVASLILNLDETLTRG